MFKIGSLVQLAVVVVLVIVAAPAQNDGVIHLPPAVSQGPGMNRVPVVAGDEVQRKQAQAAALQRLAEVRRDTEKLVQLSTELKTYVDKTDQAILSVDAVKKAEQLEKLARSVRKKMNLLY